MKTVQYDRTSQHVTGSVVEDVRQKIMLLIFPWYIYIVRIMLYAI